MPSDLGIALHHILSKNDADGTLSVSSAPCILPSLSYDECHVPAIALVLHLHSMSLKQLMSMCAWECLDEITFKFRDMEALIDGEECLHHHMHMLTQVTSNLVLSKGRFTLESADLDPVEMAACQTFLEKLQDLELVESRDYENTKAWRFSSKGQSVLSAGIRLKKYSPSTMLGEKEGPLLEKHIFQ